MKNYSKPIIEIENDFFEPVYMASGDECYVVSARIYQRPEVGRGDYRIQVDAIHNAADKHHSGAQVLTMNFNCPVSYKSSKGSLIAGDGSSSIMIEYHYHNNAQENIGLGDVVVEADAGLAVVSCTISCNHDCGQH